VSTGGPGTRWKRLLTILEWAFWIFGIAFMCFFIALVTIMAYPDGGIR
jgi:hypothetical protein